MSFLSNLALASILVTIVLLVAEFFLARVKNYLVGLILPLLCVSSIIFITWYGIVLSISLLTVYFITRYFSGKKNKKLTDIDRMNIEDLN